MYLSDLDFNTALKYVSAATVLIPLVSFIVYRHWLKDYRLLGWYLAITAIAETVGLSTMHLDSGNLFIYNFYSLLELALWAGLYMKFSPNWVKTFVFYTTILFLSAGLWRYISDPFHFSRFLYAGPRFLMIGFGFLYFMHTFQSRMLKIQSVMDWLNLAGFIYFTVTVTAFYYGAILSYQIPGLDGLWNSGLVWNIAFHLIVTHAITLSPYHRPSAA